MIIKEVTGKITKVINTMQLIKELVPEAERKPVPQDCLSLKFGRYFTDHMLVQYYKDGKWGDAKITKLTDLPLHPAAVVLHYAQEIFEGTKAFTTKSGRIAFFRIRDNIRRMNNGARKLCMPVLDEEFTYNAIKELVLTEKRFVPKQDGCSLYIRPFLVGTQPGLGVHPSAEYIFCTIMCPVGAYYPEGFKPTKIYTSDEYSRSAPKGTGDIKCGGNYAASLAGGEEAHKAGCSQFLWLDSPTHTKVEEVGAMNVFFVKEGTVYTCPLTGTILPGITRQSVIDLCKSEGIPIKEEQLTIADICESIDNGKLTEIFGTGTAASICPVSELVFKTQHHVIKGGQIGPITQKMYDMIIGIQRGVVEDKHGWLTYID